MFEGMITSGRQGGKTTAMWEEILRAFREWEARAEAEKLWLVCHPDDYDRLKAALDAFLEREFGGFARPRVQLLPSQAVYTPGVVLAFKSPFPEVDARVSEEESTG